jgi:hypothetical protein
MTYENGVFKVFLGLLILWAFSYGWFFHGIPAIDEWERTNNTPYCEFWNTCK